MDYAALSEEEQYKLVYDGICAVAARCDGAETKDNVGFNGQDTHFGRRIASVPFTEWTPAVREEAARISLTYKEQIYRYTEIEVGKLPVVRVASGLFTNHQARRDALNYERRARNADKKDLRKVTLVDGRVKISWTKGDPDFGALLDGVRALPGRIFQGDGWTVPASKAAAAFIESWDIGCTNEAADLLEAAQTAPEAKEYNVTLDAANGWLVIKTPYNPDAVSAIRSLPGRHWNGSFNTVDIHPSVLAFAERFHYTVDPAVLDALNAHQAEAVTHNSITDILRFASRQADPDNLPEEFILLVKAATVR